MRRTLIVAWSPAAVLAGCLVASLLTGAIGYRSLQRMADDQLAVAGDFVAHHVESVLASRLRAVESVAAIDAQSDDTGRDRERRAMIASLVRLHPEFAWVGFAERPGRVAVALRGMLEGEDVSRRDWWAAGLRGPYLGDAHEARMLASLLSPAADAGRRGPLRLLDVAVPLRRGDGEPHGVLAAHVDAGWVDTVRQELADVARPLGDLDVVVVQRDGATLSGAVLRLDASAAADGTVARPGALDGRPRRFSVHPVDGDVVVARLGWQVAVGRAVELHDAAARRFLAASIAGGAIVGVLGAVAVAVATSAAARPGR